MKCSPTDVGWITMKTLPQYKLQQHYWSLIQSLLVIIKALNLVYNHIFKYYIWYCEYHSGSVFVRLPALYSLLQP